MYISKKELLQLTGISYGQLYRWKREGLIPESWFIKKASYTGQETFFPHNKIIERIQAIQELKDKYSLEELAKILSPDACGDVYISQNELKQVEGVEKEILDYYMQILSLEELSYYDFILILLFHQLQKKTGINTKALHHLMDRNIKKFKNIGSIHYMLVGVSIDDLQELYLMMFNESAYMEMKKNGMETYFDTRMKIRCEISLSELNDEFRKNNKKFFL